MVEGEHCNRCSPYGGWSANPKKSYNLLVELPASLSISKALNYYMHLRDVAALKYFVLWLIDWLIV